MCKSKASFILNCRLPFRVTSPNRSINVPHQHSRFCCKIPLKKYKEHRICNEWSSDAVGKIHDGRQIQLKTFSEILIILKRSLRFQKMDGTGKKLCKILFYSAETFFVSRLALLGIELAIRQSKLILRNVLLFYSDASTFIN